MGLPVVGIGVWKMLSNSSSSKPTPLMLPARKLFLLPLRRKLSRFRRLCRFLRVPLREGPTFSVNLVDAVEADLRR